MCLNIGTPKNINFSFETNGKLMALGVPILKHSRVNLKHFANTTAANAASNADASAIALPVGSYKGAKNIYNHNNNLKAPVFCRTFGRKIQIQIYFYRIDRKK